RFRVRMLQFSDDVSEKPLFLVNQVYLARELRGKVFDDANEGLNDVGFLILRCDVDDRARPDFSEFMFPGHRHLLRRTAKVVWSPGRDFLGDSQALAAPPPRS